MDVTAKERIEDGRGRNSVATGLSPNKVGAIKPIPYLVAAAFLALSGFFVAKIPVKPELAFVSSIFVIVFTIPSYAALLRWVGRREGVKILVVLGLFAIGIESFAVATGYPYGDFHYSDRIGALLFGLVPWTVPFAWTPLLLASYTLAQRVVGPLASRSTIIAASALFLVAIDLVLDPAAVTQKFWAWSAPGPYYGVPLINFVGWLISGAIGSYLFAQMTERALMHAADTNGASSDTVRLDQTPPGLLASGFLILCFWLSVCFWMELWIPAVLGAALLAFTAKHLFSSGVAKS